QRRIHGVSTPMVRVRPLASEAAEALGAYPSPRAASSTRARVASLTPGRWRSARETVAVETPAARATSSMAAFTAGKCALLPTGAQHCVEDWDKTIGLHRAGVPAGRSPSDLVGPAHRHAHPGPAEHLDVVLPVTGGQGRLRGHVQTLAHQLQGTGLGHPVRGDVQPR